MIVRRSLSFRSGLLMKVHECHVEKINRQTDSGEILSQRGTLLFVIFIPT